MKPDPIDRLPWWMHLIFLLAGLICVPTIALEWWWAVPTRFLTAVMALIGTVGVIGISIARLVEAYVRWAGRRGVR